MNRRGNRPRERRGLASLVAQLPRSVTLVRGESVRACQVMKGLGERAPPRYSSAHTLALVTTGPGLFPARLV